MVSSLSLKASGDRVETIHAIAQCVPMKQGFIRPSPRPDIVDSAELEPDSKLIWRGLVSKSHRTAPS
jgi:hypothetical protein